MTPHRLKARIRWAAIAAIAGLAWFAGPHWVGGYWRGDYFSCLCSADMVAEFRDGQVVTHLDPWSSSADSLDLASAISSRAAGTYRRTGWHSFEWSQPTDRADVSRLKFVPGWIFCRIEDSEACEVWWGYREYNVARILRIRAHQQQMLPQRASANGRLPSGSDFEAAARAGGAGR